jgi:hypothetical protein
MIRWEGFAPEEEAGVLVVKTICGKSLAKATVAMATNKRQQVAALCHTVLASPTFVRPLG